MRVLAVLSSSVLLAWPAWAQSDLSAMALCSRSSKPARASDTPSCDILVRQSTGAAKTPSRLIDGERLAGADVLVVGEIHDNPLHHRIQARLLRAFASRKPRPPALVLEHVTTAQRPALQAFQSRISALPAAARNQAARTLGTALGWGQTGWPDWAMFQPIAEAAFAVRAEILPGNLDRETVRAVARKGLAALRPDERKGLDFDHPLPAPLHQALVADLEAGHCNLVPRAGLAPMVRVQRLRDAVLARAAFRAAQKAGAAIVFAGNGHARTDRGLRGFLRQAGPALDVLTIVLVERSADRTNAPGRSLDTLGARGPDGKLAADIMIVTPAVTRPDPCVRLRKHFRKKS